MSHVFLPDGNNVDVVLPSIHPRLIKAFTVRALVSREMVLHSVASSGTIEYVYPENSQSDSLLHDQAGPKPQLTLA